ncbi:MAG: NADH pyrophosphatase, partial [Pseudolabrys sp.]
MSPRPDLGPRPRLGYCEGRIERAAELRADAAAIDALARKPGAGTYVIGGEWIVMKKGSPLHEPLF